MRYALVYPWGVGCIITGDTEAVGVVRYAPGTFNQYGVVLNFYTMLDPSSNECCFKEITQAEFETYLEFGTHRELRRRFLWENHIRDSIRRIYRRFDLFEWVCLGTLGIAVVAIVALAFGW